MLHDPTSMVKTLDAINEKFLFGEAIPQGEAMEAARWIIAQQGKKGSYRGMSAPTAQDFEVGIRLFTGERLVSASARHIMGQEAARAAWLIGQSDPTVRETYNQATSWMKENIEFQNSGTFCCARCTLAFWRHFQAGNFENQGTLIRKGLQSMGERRTGDGKWHNLPFHYAVYTLLDLDIDLATLELEYARPAMEKYLQRPKAGIYTERRLAICMKALDRIN
ncbi:MAG: hypothetical protein ACM3H7_06170 [Acidobacteriaceae bacterium]